MSEPLSPRERLLDILRRDPRSAVVLAEILASPVSIRPPK